MKIHYHFNDRGLVVYESFEFGEKRNPGNQCSRLKCYLTLTINDLSYQPPPQKLSRGEDREPQGYPKINRELKTGRTGPMSPGLSLVKLISSAQQTVLGTV
ncbi:hypothetical protein ElyMa_005763600 [Elysia marginata]|uniref:Uncharacterized protein n=1 Tax=Elysia marginata TaxID=1093978 RepID=A0AAV4FR30_9GAST|nr:hypothetical protein ElyMa_005763600 [Elysia marginata]